MTPQMPTLRFTLTLIGVVAFTAAVVIRYAQACLCDNCRDPWAVWVRGTLQLCRQCRVSYDRSIGRVRRRRSILRRIWRRTA